MVRSSTALPSTHRTPEAIVARPRRRAMRIRNLTGVRRTATWGPGLRSPHGRSRRASKSGDPRHLPGEPGLVAPRALPATSRVYREDHRDETPWGRSTWLGPLHAWFSCAHWVWPHGYRVIGVVCGTVLTATVVALCLPSLSVPAVGIGSLMLWLALAIIEDHAGRRGGRVGPLLLRLH